MREPPIVTPAESLPVALIQMDSGQDVAANVALAERLTREAARAGARFIALPEMYHFRSTGKPASLPGEPIGGPSLRGLQVIAAEYGAVILAGSVCEAIAGSFKVHNTSVLIGPDGAVVATYRKIHLFDVEVDGVAIRESDWYVPGDQVVTAQACGRTVGLSICYDLRFPELFRRHADRQAEILTVPASFTATSGAAHWESLLRARAIENQAFVLAPGQTGPGSGGVMTHGHSLVVDPWGVVLAEGSAGGTEIVTARLDFARLAEVRRRLPALGHRRLG
ncbi:carbon-nitrogen hydrolase family protein [bacterium]|nr:carbon-nitrogen hydrolase family protein [bacterium]